MIKYNIIPPVVCEMWKVKFLANTKHNIAKQTTASFASDFTVKICLMLPI